jgi:hypothetical protein
MIYLGGFKPGVGKLNSGLSAVLIYLFVYENNSLATSKKQRRLMDSNTKSHM